MRVGRVKFNVGKHVRISKEKMKFAQKPVQTSVQMIATIFRHIASVDQSDLEFLIPAEHYTYRLEYQTVCTR